MSSLVFWIDVDNTLLDNDRAKEEYDNYLQIGLGPQLTARFWQLYEEVRKEQSVIDIPVTLVRLREETPLSQMDELTYQHALSVFENFPFQKLLYPQVLETLAYLNTLGLVVIVSDGDEVFQAEKIFNSSLAEAVQGRVLLYIHKQEHLDEIMSQYPADHYAMIDDKPQILHDTKTQLGNRVTTIFVKQGKYAAAAPPEHFTPDITVAHIADVQQLSREQFLHDHS
jgi:FMN phosphatase YigB (HAD superfamily)